MREIHRYRRHLLVLYLAVLLASTLAPIRTRDPFPDDFDKLAHILLFAGLGALIFWNLASGLLRLARILSAALASALCAGLIEVLQVRVPRRSGDVQDFLAGAIGAILGAVLAHLAARRLFRQGSGDQPDIGRSP